MSASSVDFGKVVSSSLDVRWGMGILFKTKLLFESTTHGRWICSGRGEENERGRESVCESERQKKNKVVRCKEKRVNNRSPEGQRGVERERGKTLLYRSDSDFGENNYGGSSVMQCG